MPTRFRSVAWVKHGGVGVEFAEIVLAGRTLKAAGFAVGSDPVPYRLRYRLETDPGFITSCLYCEARGEGWSRSLDLRRSAQGAWSVQARADGTCDLPTPGGSPASLGDALDCDLGLSPLTNSLPILRKQMMTTGGVFELSMAWVSVPDLAVTCDRQRYIVRAPTPSDRWLVRYEAVDGSFAADILIDADGIALDYPGVGRRLGNV